MEADWKSLREISHGNFWLFSPDLDPKAYIIESPDVMGALLGYIRDEGLQYVQEPTSPEGSLINRRFLEAVVAGAWPLGDGWTGNFSAVGYSKQRQQLVICNDVLGFLPLYYQVLTDGVIGATHLNLLSHFIQAAVDPVGVMERITSPYYCNYGRRTLLKDVERLLPGEWAVYSINSTRIQTRFDNSLYNDVWDGDIKSIARTTWDSLRSEVNAAVDSRDQIFVALSGGWDSRHILGSLAHLQTALNCLTIGEPDIYEAEIARRCANTVGAVHQCFSIEGKYFPPLSSMINLVKETEAVNFLTWNAILSGLNNQSSVENILLLGDLCESIDGRNMKMFSTKEARIKSFFQEKTGKIENYFPATSENFLQWKESNKSLIVKTLLNRFGFLSSELCNIYELEELEQHFIEDLELTFDRIQSMMPPFTCQFDEILRWFTFVRYSMASQILLMSSAFNTLSPPMSMRFLRFITKVHPRFRRRRRLMRAIAHLPELAELGRIPSAQIPYLNMRLPGILLDLMWGFRWRSDGFLTRRVLRKKNPSGKQRLVKSLNYLQEYRREGVVETVSSWFSMKWIKPDYYINRVQKRANLGTLPLINVDIATPANISLILDLCDPQI